MEWEQIARDGGGWLASTLMVAWFARAWLRGEVVSGKTHDYVKDELKRVSQRAEEVADEQRRSSAAEREALLAIIRKQGVNEDGGEPG